MTQAGEILLGLLILTTSIACSNKNKQQIQNKKAETVVVQANPKSDETIPCCTASQELTKPAESIEKEASEIKIADEPEIEKPIEYVNVEIRKTESIPQTHVIDLEDRKKTVEEKKPENSTKTQIQTNYNEERRNKMEIILSSTLGTIFYTITVFVAGALVGAPLWNWVSAKLPWNK